MNTAHALKSLYGAGKREQTVFTPQCIIDVVVAAFVRQIQYDPCHGPPGYVLNAAGRQIKRDDCLPDDPIAAGLAVPVESCVNAVRTTDCLGLISPWLDGTFCNCPYDQLHAWLEMSMMQNVDHIMLVPVRCHRKWWRKWASGVELVALNPITFVGHEQSIPLPMCLARSRHRLGRLPGSLTGLCEERGLGGAW